MDTVFESLVNRIRKDERLEMTAFEEEELDKEILSYVSNLLMNKVHIDYHPDMLSIEHELRFLYRRLDEVFSYHYKLKQMGFAELGKEILTTKLLFIAANPLSKTEDSKEVVGGEEVKQLIWAMDEPMWDNLQLRDIGSYLNENKEVETEDEEYQTYRTQKEIESVKIPEDMNIYELFKNYIMEKNRALYKTVQMNEEISDTDIDGNERPVDLNEEMNEYVADLLKSKVHQSYNPLAFHQKYEANTRSYYYGYIANMYRDLSEIQKYHMELRAEGLPNLGKELLVTKLLFIGGNPLKHDSGRREIIGHDRVIEIRNRAEKSSWSELKLKEVVHKEGTPITDPNVVRYEKLKSEITQKNREIYKEIKENK